MAPREEDAARANALLNSVRLPVAQSEPTSQPQGGVDNAGFDAGPSNTDEDSVHGAGVGRPGRT